MRSLTRLLIAAPHHRSIRSMAHPAGRGRLQHVERFPHEKGNNNIGWGMMETFNCWIQNLGLINIEIPKRKFTWSNRRQTCYQLGLDSACFRPLSSIASDHAPVPQAQACKLFHFELAFVEIRNIIHSSWTRPTRPEQQ